MHSKFGRILLTRNLNGMWPCLDPLQAVPRGHIEEAARRVGVRPQEVGAQVDSLSAFLGWDITSGARPPENE
jgi:hypothetical protein